jgi:flagellar biosynthesis chaperone FliJ
MAAARDRRIVELLEARREQEGVREETRREQRTTDEVAGRRGREMSDRAVTNE